jgi:hypothetical protein
VNGRNPNPDRHEILARLRNQATGETEPAVALRGFVDDGRDADHLRLYPDMAYQRWMDIPRADILDSAPFDDQGRTVVWVDRDSMNEPLFAPNTIEQLTTRFTGPWMSTWALIPEARDVAAEMLELVAPWVRGEDEEGRYT